MRVAESELDTLTRTLTLRCEGRIDSTAWQGRSSCRTLQRQQQLYSIAETGAAVGNTVAADAAVSASQHLFYLSYETSS